MVAVNSVPRCSNCRVTTTVLVAAWAITGAVTVSDVDNTNLSSATIQITGNYVNGEDVLSFTNTASITGTSTKKKDLRETLRTIPMGVKKKPVGMVPREN